MCCLRCFAIACEKRCERVLKHVSLSLLAKCVYTHSGTQQRGKRMADRRRKMTSGVSLLPEMSSSWPDAYVKVEQRIKSLLLSNSDSGEVESLAMRFYSLVNSDWEDDDAQRVLSELVRDVHQFERDVEAARTTGAGKKHEEYHTSEADKARWKREAEQQKAERLKQSQAKGGGSAPAIVDLALLRRELATREGNSVATAQYLCDILNAPRCVLYPSMLSNTYKDRDINGVRNNMIAPIH